MALLDLENIAVLAISKEVVQGIGHGSPQVIIRLVFAQIISEITGSEVTPFAVITDESTGVKYPLADYELLPKMAIVDADMMMNAPRASPPPPVSTPSPTLWKPMPPKYFQAVSSRKNLFPFLIMCHDFRSNRNQLTVFNRIDDVTELLKIFIVVGCQENCFSLGF